MAEGLFETPATSPSTKGRARCQNDYATHLLGRTHSRKFDFPKMTARISDVPFFTPYRLVDRNHSVADVNTLQSHSF
ncbi:hypothetical protein ES702_00404 [subsurface metagenome]